MKTVAKRLPYPGGFPVYLSRYVLFPEGCRVALRFFNASETEFTGVRFLLVEKGADGSEIASRTVERRGLSAERGREFSLPDEPVSEGCAEVEARLIAALSDGYEYCVEGSEVILRYGEEAPPAEREISFTEPPSHSVSKRYKWVVLFSLCAVLGLALVAAGSAWFFGIFDSLLPQPDGAAETGTVTEYVEA